MKGVVKFIYSKIGILNNIWEIKKVNNPIIKTLNSTLNLKLITKIKNIGINNPIIKNNIKLIIDYTCIPATLLLLFIVIDTVTGFFLEKETE